MLRCRWSNLLRFSRTITNDASIFQFHDMCAEFTRPAQILLGHKNAIHSVTFNRDVPVRLIEIRSALVVPSTVSVPPDNDAKSC